MPGPLKKNKAASSVERALAPLCAIQGYCHDSVVHFKTLFKLYVILELFQYDVCLPTVFHSQSIFDCF